MKKFLVASMFLLAASLTAFQGNTIANQGSITITLKTATDTVYLDSGDPIYILDRNGHGEINWITAINADTGVLTLREPISRR